MRSKDSEASTLASRAGAGFVVVVDAEPCEAYPGETVASLLFRIGRCAFRHSRVRNEPRSMFCGMGLCHECLVTVDGLENVRACMTELHAGMYIETTVVHDRGVA